MDKTQITQALRTNHQQFADYIQSLTVEEFLHRKDNKWTAGQQAEHIVKSISPVVMAMSLPKFVPKMLFGRSNRPSKTFEGLVEKYQQKLAKGGTASGRFLPKEVGLQEKTLLPKAIIHYTSELCKLTEKLTEEELDKYLLPHPLLGKLTFREMLFFTAYHAEHHHQLTKRDLGK